MARGRKPNEIPTEKFPISTTSQVVSDLKALVQTGYFGKNPAEAAERILGERLRTMRKDEPGLFKKRRS